MKNIYKLAAVGTILASSVVAASAQSTTRRAYDQPDRYWNSGLTSGHVHGGYVMNEPSSWRNGDETSTNMLATPGSQEERDNEGQGG